MSQTISIYRIRSAPSGFEYVTKGNNKEDVLLNALGQPVLRRIGVTIGIKEDGAMGWRNDKYDTSFSASPTLYTTGAETIRDTFRFQGYNLPLTEDEIIEGYKSIRDTGTWTDPRSAKHRLYEEEGTSWTVDGKTSSSWAFNPDSKGGADVFGYLNWQYGSISEGHLSLDPDNIDVLLDRFLRVYTTGDAYGGHGSQSESFEIMMGRDSVGSPISLYQMFDKRMPLIEGSDVERLPEPLPPEYVEGVHTDIPLEEIGALYMDIALRSGFNVADEIMQGMPAHLRKKWQQRDANTKEIQTYGADPKMLDVFARALTREVILEHETGILGVDPEVIRGLTTDKNLTVNGRVTWDNKNSAKNYLNELADALAAYQANPNDMTWLQRDALHRLKLAEVPLLLGESSFDDVGEDTAEAAANAVLDEIKDWASHRNLIDNWADKETVYLWVRDAIANAHPKDSDNFSMDRDPNYDMAGYSNTYGQSVLSSMSRDSAGNNYTPGMNYFQSGSLNAELINGATGVPVGGIEFDAEVVGWGIYQTAWLEELLEAQLPLYQETEIGGFTIADRDKYYDLRDNQNVALKEPPEGNDTRSAQEKDLWDLHVKLNGSRIKFSPDELNGNEAWGEDEPHYLWFDPTRLYMKMPENDLSQDFLTTEPIGTINGHQISGQNFQTRSTSQKYFEGEMPEYDYFAVGNDELTLEGSHGTYTQKQNRGEGWFYDLSKGDAPVGSYTMVWVEQPMYWEKPPSEAIWNNPFVRILASINPAVNVMFTAFRAAVGETLHLGDYLSLGVSAAKLSGNLKKPATTADAEKAGEAAREAAEAEAVADGFVGTTVVSMGDVAYQTAYDMAISDVGFGSLNYKQTMTVINAAKAKNENDAIGILLDGFGQDYFESGLDALGLDTSKINDDLMDDIFDVTTQVVRGVPFEEAAAGAVGSRVVDLFEDMGDDTFAAAKTFIKTLVGDLQDGLDTILDIDLEDSAFQEAFGDIMDMLEEIDEATNFSEIIKQSTDTVMDSLGSVQAALDVTVDKLNEVVFKPLKDTVVSGMSKFTNISEIPGVSENFEDSVNKFVDSIGEAGKATWDELGDGVKDSLKEAIGLELLAGGDTTLQQRQNIFTKNLVTMDAVSKVDSDVTDAIPLPILTQAVRNAVGAAIGDGPAPGRVFLDTIANASVAAIKKLVDSGDGDALVDAIKDFSDKITGKYGETVDLQNELDGYDDQYADKLKERDKYQKDLDDMKDERARLFRLATEPGATEADVNNYETFNSQYVSAAPTIIQQINTLTAEINAIPQAYNNTKAELTSARNTLTAETAAGDLRLQPEFDNLYVATLEQLNPDFDYVEYLNLAMARGASLEATDTKEDIAKLFIEDLAAGEPTTLEDYNALYSAQATKILTSVFDAMGVTIHRHTPESLQKLSQDFLRFLAYTNSATTGGTDKLSRLQAYNDELLTKGTLDGKSIVDFFAEPRIHADEVVAEAITPLDIKIQEANINQIGDYLNDLINEGYDSDTRLFDQSGFNFNINPDGAATFGGDGFTYTEWSDSEQKFVTYQYNESGTERYKLNDDGTAPLESGRVYESKGMALDLMSSIKTDPTATLAVLNNLDDKQALSLHIDMLEENHPEAEELTYLKELEQKMDDGYVPSDLDKPLALRVAETWMEGAQKMVTDAEDALAAWEIEQGHEPGHFAGKLKNNPGQRAFDNESEQKAYNKLVSNIQKAKDNVDFQANFVVGAPTKIGSFVASGLAAMKAWIKTMPAMAARDGAFRRAVAEGKDVEKANELAQKEFQETLLTTEEDVDAIFNNDYVNIHNQIDQYAQGFLSDELVADTAEMHANIAAATGAVDKAKAIFGELYDKPDAFLGYFLGDELVPQLMTFGLSGFVGKQVTNVTAKSLGKDIAEALGSTASVGANATLELSEAFGETAVGTYNEVASELERIGFEGDIDAKAKEMAIRAGTQAIVILGATAPFGAFALDNRVLSKGTNDILYELSDRVEDLATVVTKESLTEFVQEAYVAGFTEQMLYDAGVTDRDVEGNIIENGVVGALIGGTTSAVTYGLTTPPPFYPTGGGGSDDMGTSGYTGNVFTSALLSNSDIRELSSTTSFNKYLENFLGGSRATIQDPDSTDPIEQAIGIIKIDVGNQRDDLSYLTADEARKLFVDAGMQGAIPEGAVTEFMQSKSDSPWVKAAIEAGSSDPVDMAENYLVYTYGEQAIGTGYTSAQHYDIIEHIRAIARDEAVLSGTFDYNNDNAISEADVDAYIANLPLREQTALENYDASKHEPTGIIDEIGGSLGMNSQDLLKLQQDIETLLARDPSATPQQVVDALINDPTNSGILQVQIETAVANQFKKDSVQSDFAEAIVDKLVADGTISSEVSSELKTIIGDPDAVVPEGVFKILEDLKTQIGLGDGDPESLTAYITDKIGTAGTFEDGVYQDDGTGLLGELTAQGVLQDVAIAEIKNLVGDPGDGTDANPATGIYEILGNLDIDFDTTALEGAITELANKIPDDLEATLLGLATNLGTPATATDVATGLYALVGDAITASENATAAGQDAKKAVEDILGDYATFAEFETALTGTIDEKIQGIADSFGKAPVFQYDVDGNVLRDEVTGQPLFATELRDHDDDPSTDKVEVVVGAPSGIQADIYNAMQLQGIDRDLALAVLETNINDKLVELQNFTTNATAAAIKTDILDVYFPAYTEDFDLGKEVAAERDYLLMMSEGLIPADLTYDYNGDGEVGADDLAEWAQGLTSAEATAENNYNTWAANKQGITPAIETLRAETDTGFKLVDSRLTSIESNVKKEITDNVNLAIGSPSSPLVGATGIYAAIEAGDTSITDILGSAGEDGSGVLRNLELLGLDAQEIKTFLETNLGSPAVSEDDATDTNPAKPATGVYALVDANTEQYKGLVDDYKILTNNYEVMSSNYSALLESANEQFGLLNNAIGQFPTLNDAGEYTGGGGLRLELFNQGLNINQINELLGSEGDEDSIVGKLKALQNGIDKAASTTDITGVLGEISALSTIVGSPAQPATDTEPAQTASGIYEALANVESTLKSTFNAELKKVTDAVNALSLGPDGTIQSSIRELAGQLDRLTEQSEITGVGQANTEVPASPLMLATIYAGMRQGEGFMVDRSYENFADPRMGMFHFGGSTDLGEAINFLEQYVNDNLSGEDLDAFEYFVDNESERVAAMVASDDPRIGLAKEVLDNGILSGLNASQIYIDQLDALNASLVGSPSDIYKDYGPTGLYEVIADAENTIEILRGELAAQGVDVDTINATLGSEDDENSIIGRIEALKTATESNTGKYEDLLQDYKDISDDYSGLADDYKGLVRNYYKKTQDISNNIGVLPTWDAEQQRYVGGSGIRKELFDQGLSLDQINTLLGSATDEASIMGKLEALKSVPGDITTVAGDIAALNTIIGEPKDSSLEGSKNSGIFLAIEDLSTTTASNTEKYESLLQNYSDISEDYSGLVDDYNTAVGEANTALGEVKTAIGELPTFNDETKEYEGGSGIRKELFDQGLSLDQINTLLGSAEDPDSILGALEELTNTDFASEYKLKLVQNDVNNIKASTTQLKNLIGKADSNQQKEGAQPSGIYKEIANLAATTASNTEKYETLLQNYSDISGSYDTLSTSIDSTLTNINTAIGELPTWNAETKAYEGGSGLRKELFDQGLTLDQVNAVLGSEDDADSILGRLKTISGATEDSAKKADLDVLSNLIGSPAVSEDDATDDNPAKAADGIFGEIEALSNTTASNTEKYETLLEDYGDVSNKYDALAEDYKTLADNTANKITAIDNTIGELPTDDDGDGVFEGGSGLRLELFNQGLGIDQINAILGSEDNPDTVVGKLKSIADATDLYAKQTDLSALSSIIGSPAVSVFDATDDNPAKAADGIFKAIDELATTTASNTEKYEDLLQNYSDITERYATVLDATKHVVLANAQAVSNIQQILGYVPDINDDGSLRGGAGLSLKLYEQGLTIDQINAVLGSEDDENSIIGRLNAIDSSTDTFAKQADIAALTAIIGSPAVSEDDATGDTPAKAADGIFKAIDDLATATISNTEKYEGLLQNYSDISGQYNTLTEDYKTLADSTANKIAEIDSTIGELPTFNDETQEYEGGSGLRLELFNQGLGIDEINAVLGSAEDENSIVGKLETLISSVNSAASSTDLQTASGNIANLATIVGVKDSDLETEGDQSTGLYGEIQTLAATTASNTEKYETLLQDYSDISGQYNTLAEDYKTLADSTADKITAIDNTIGELPTDNGDGTFSGGSGLRLELFNQGLGIDEINAVLGSAEDENSIIGRLAALQNATSSAASSSDLNSVTGSLDTLATIVGVKDSDLETEGDQSTGLYGEIQNLANVTASNTEKYETLLQNYSDISGRYETLAESTAEKIAAIDSTIGELPTDNGDGTFSGGSGLRLELFNQGLGLDEINALLGSEDDPASIVGRLSAITNATSAAVTASDLTPINNALNDLTAAIGSPAQPATDTEPAQSASGIYAELAGLVSAEVSSEISEIGTSLDDIAALLGKPTNLLTEEDVNLVSTYLAEEEVAYNALYDVNNDGTFDVEDERLIGNAFESGDYSEIADSNFGHATGMFAIQEQNQATIEQQQQDLVAAQQQYELDLAAEREAAVEAQREMQLEIESNIEQQLEQQAEQETEDKVMEALQAPGRKVTTKPGRKAEIKGIYDFESIFQDEEQESFYGAASPYGDNFLNDILFPQQRAKGGIIKDKTDEILKIIGDK